MAKIQYISKTFRTDTMAVVDKANEIISEYMAEGFKLTLRQLYYQFVARDLLENSQRSYKRLGSIINDARLAGLIDWEAIEDRTRNLQSLASWRDPGQIVRAAADQFKLDHWQDQRFRVEVWIEKEALSGVIAGICDDLDVPYFSCKGYVSQSEMWSASQRLHYWLREGVQPVVIHLGDHDPSGLDMTRDIQDRYNIFNTPEIKVERIALNFDQIDQYQPPPNPAKVQDSRFNGYVEKYGRQSWELDALEPRVMRDLIRDKVESYRDDELYNNVLEQEAEYSEALRAFADKWE